MDDRIFEIFGLVNQNFISTVLVDVENCKFFFLSRVIRVTSVSILDFRFSYSMMLKFSALSIIQIQV